MKFNTVACGGTFDHFHKGHRSLLKLAFSLGKKVVVGITSDIYVQNSKSIEPFEKRKQSVLEFVKKEGVEDKVEITKINDLFGPILSKDLQVDAIVVSEDTIKNAEIINEEREKIGLPSLKIIVQALIKGEDENIISSSRIRQGEIDRNGRPYVNPLWLEKKLFITDDLRKKLKEPFDAVINTIKNYRKDYKYLITVGDITTKVLNNSSSNANISIIDFNVARKKKFTDFKELGFSGNEKVITVSNPPGCLTPDLFFALLSIFKLKDVVTKTILKIDGEEDLSALAVILTSPLESIILYGQPNLGMVEIIVSEEKKEKAYNLVSRFVVDKE